MKSSRTLTAYYSKTGTATKVLDLSDDAEVVSFVDELVS